MSEKKETVPELPRGTRPDSNDEYYVPDYVMRDFGEAEELSSPSAWAFGRHSGGGSFL